MMTNDLVRRLHDKIEASKIYDDDITLATIVKVIKCEELLDEAADEILHLRTRLQDIANFSLHGDYSNAHEMPEIALRALAGKVTKND